MTGLTPETLKVLDQVSTLSCIKDYTLVGGTALALQINHRLSEDLDFCKWISDTSANNGIDIKAINSELVTKFKVSVNQIDFDQVDFLINEKVKLQFFNEVGYTLPSAKQNSLKGNINAAPIETIAAMKIKTMFQRNAFRDYYDVFVILKENHITPEQLIELAMVYNPKLNRKMIINRLMGWEKFREEKSFGQLAPKHNVSPRAIGMFMETIKWPG